MVLTALAVRGSHSSSASMGRKGRESMIVRTRTACSERAGAPSAAIWSVGELTTGGRGFVTAVFAR